MVPEENIVKVYEEQFTEHWPYKRTAEQQQEDLNNSNESDHTDDMIFDEKLDSFRQWWETYYVGKMNERTRKRNRPIFPHSMWSKNKMVLNDADTTTNRSEGYNNQLKLRTPKNASIWTLIEQLKKEDCHVDNKMRQTAYGIDPEAGRQRTKDNLNKLEKLKKLVSNYHNINDDEKFLNLLLEFYQTDWTFSGM